MNEFDVRKYQNENSTLVDGTDALANKRQLVISFYHVPSRRSISFKAFITTFNESYNSNFTPHETFGRTDPIYQYKSTTRKISLAFKIPAASESEAYENLGRISALEQMLYPNYSELDSATTLAQAPLIRIKVMNLLSKDFNSPLRVNNVAAKNLLEGSAENPRNIVYNGYNSVSNPATGLLGVVDNLNVNHNLEGDDGVFFKRAEGGGRALGVPNTILPKLIDVNLAFSPIHEHTLGWQGEDKFSIYTFPYGVLTDATEPKTLNYFDRKQTAYNEQKEKEKAAEQQKKLRQQRKDNAKAKFSEVLGGLRTKRLERQEIRTLERRAYRRAEVKAGLADLRERMQEDSQLEDALGVLNSINEFIE